MSSGGDRLWRRQMRRRQLWCCCCVAFSLLFLIAGWPEIDKNLNWPEAKCTILGSAVRNYADCDTYYKSGCGATCTEAQHCERAESRFAATVYSTRVSLGIDRYAGEYANDLYRAWCRGGTKCCEESCDWCPTYSRSPPLCHPRTDSS